VRQTGIGCCLLMSARQGTGPLCNCGAFELFANVARILLNAFRFSEVRYCCPRERPFTPDSTGLNHIGGPRFSACSGACSHRTLLPFTATSCKIEMVRRSFVLSMLCEYMRRRAACCNIPRFGLKIRRGQPRGGSTPPPGTK
jgi:hypothetical protein